MSKEFAKELRKLAKQSKGQDQDEYLSFAVSADQKQYSAIKGSLKSVDSEIRDEVALAAKKTFGAKKASELLGLTIRESKMKLLPLENESWGFLGSMTSNGYSKKEIDKLYKEIAMILAKNYGFNDPIKIRQLFDSRAGRHMADSAHDNYLDAKDIVADVFRSQRKFYQYLPHYIGEAEEARVFLDPIGKITPEIKDRLDYQLNVWKGGKPENTDKGLYIKFKTSNDAKGFIRGLKSARDLSKVFDPTLVKEEVNKMSLLTVNVEDLLTAKTNDARTIAKSTMKQDQDDLVSDKDREKDDGGASDAIDTALTTGKVHQEKKMKGEDPCWKDYEMVGHKKKNGKKVPNCVPKESQAVFEELEDFLAEKKVPLNTDRLYKIKQFDPSKNANVIIQTKIKKITKDVTGKLTVHFNGLGGKPKKLAGNVFKSKVVESETLEEANDYNKKVFLNKAEHIAYAHYLARKAMKHPMTGQPMFDDVYMLELSQQSGDTVGLMNMMADSAVKSGLSDSDEYMKALAKGMETASSLSPESAEALKWKTITHSIQPVI